MSPEEEIRIVRFYRDEQEDHRGRKLSEILNKSNEWLEHTHDYIQWLFPLSEPSAHNVNAPILSFTEIERFNLDKVLRDKLIDSFKLMLQFYGLRLIECADGGMNVTKCSSFESRRQNWLTAGNHNFLRITRVLKSLCLLGLRKHAQALFECLDSIYVDNKKIVGAKTFEFWCRAIR